MSVHKEPSGRRSVQIEVEVPGTPEQVWQAIATGPGISSWFVPTTLEGRPGGALSCDFGGGMVSSATITEWQPPHRFVAEDRVWLQGGPPVATEWTVTAQQGGTCIVRVVHSLFASTEEWDGQLEGTEHGWPGYFRVLRHYLAHHAGQPAAALVLSAPGKESAQSTWQTLARALDLAAPLAAPQSGAPVGIDLPDGSSASGTVLAFDETPQGLGVMVALEQPTTGVMLASAMDCMGMRLATVQLFFYGERAAQAAAGQGHWQRWLDALFPAQAP